MMMNIVVLFILFIGVSKSCRYNTDCKKDYEGQDACYMNAVYRVDSDVREGFCFGSSGWFSDGKCMHKRSLGMPCTNAGGNADNNFCVTRLCSAEDGNICMHRTGGYASFGNMVATIGADLGLLSQSYIDYGDNLPGTVNVQSANCNDPDNHSGQCTGKFSVAPKTGCVEFQYRQDVFDILGVNGKIGGCLPSLGADADLRKMEFSVSLNDMEIYSQGEITFNLDEFTGAFDKRFVLNDGDKRCGTPAEPSKCKPKMLFQKTVRLGKASVNVEIGYNIAAHIFGEVSSGEGYKHTISMDKSLKFPSLSLTLGPNGVDFDADSPDKNFVIDSWVEGTGQVDTKVTARIGAQLFFSINGLSVYGGGEFQYVGKSLFNTDGDICTSGSAAMMGAVVVGFDVPEIDVGAAFNAACTAVLGEAHKHPSDKVVQADRYGSECLIYDPCSHPTLCNAMGNVLNSLVKDIAGSSTITPGYSKCETLVSSPQVRARWNVGSYNDCEGDELTVQSTCDNVDVAYTALHQVKTCGVGSIAATLFLLLIVFSF
jgi:hypothetical protein